MKIRALVQPNQQQLQGWLNWRICYPFEYLRQYRVDAKEIWLDVGELPKESDIDIIIIPRLIVGLEARPSIEDWINKLKNMNITLVFEVDDDIFSESFMSSLSKVMFLDKEPDTKLLLATLSELELRADAAKWIMNQCDAITTSTHKLAEYIKTITNLDVHVIPNSISERYFKEGLVERGVIVNNPTVGWAGGKRSLDELKIMLDAWKLLVKSGRNITFVATDWLAKILEEDELFAGRLISTPWLPMNKYAINYQVDIGCCSVDNSLFSLRKSTIKAYEYALAGALPVGTMDLYENEPSMLVANNAEDYAQIIHYYLDNIGDRLIMSREFQRHVLTSHNLEYNWLYWADAYSRIRFNNTVELREKELVSE